MLKDNNKSLFYRLHEWILQICMNMDKQVRVIQVPMQKAKEIIECFTGEIKWRIKTEYESDEFATIRIENPETSLKNLFISREPQVVLWKLKKEGVNLRIENVCLYKKSYAHLIWLLLIYSFIFAIIFMLAGRIEIGLVFTLIFLLLSLLWLGTSGKPRIFIENIYSKIEEKSKTNSVLIKGGSSNPNVPIHIIMSYILIVLFMFSASITSLLVPLILSILLGIIFFSLIYFVYGSNARYSEFVSIHITNFLTGITFAATAIMPYILMQVEKYHHQPPRESYYIIVTAYIILFIITIIKNISLTKDIIRYEAKRITLFEASEKDPYLTKPYKVFRITLFFIWIMSATAVIYGTCFSLSLIGKDHLYIEKHDYTTSKYATQLAYHKDAMAVLSSPLTRDKKNKAYKEIREKYLNGIHKQEMLPPSVVNLMFFWCVPILLVLLYVFWLWIAEVVGLIKSRRNQVPDNLNKTIEKLSKYFKTEKPQVIVENSQYLYSQIRVLFIWKPIMVISKGMLESLSDERMEAIVAHEMWHKKKHAFSLAIWNTLFTMTMFGSNNSSVLTNSLELEFEADEQAVNFLKSIGSSKAILINALKKIIEENNKIEIRQLLDVLKNASMSIYSDSKKGSECRDTEGIHVLNKIKTGLTNFCDIYFGRKDYGYIHPTLNQRIRRLEENHA